MNSLNYRHLEDHLEFVLDKLLPLIVGHAHSSGTPSKTVALAAFFALATILQYEGMERDALMDAVDSANLPQHGIPKGIH